MLSIESSSELCGISLFRDKKIIDTIQEKKAKSHSELLGQFVHQIIKSHNISVKDLSCVAVNIGPGSYTGLRIGLSLAKGLAVPFKIPIIGVPGFDILRYKYNLTKIQEEYSVTIFSHSTYVYIIDYKTDTISLIDYKNISKNNLYGHNLIKLPKKIIYTEIFSDSISLGELALINYKKYIKEDIFKINPIYISNNQLYDKTGNK